MWMIIFLLLPIVGIAYVSWHLYMLVPLPAIWRWGVVGLLIGSFLLMFCNMWRATDQLPLPLARLVYDIGNSSVFILLYLTIIFLVLDLGRLVRLVPRDLLCHNFYTTAALAGGLFLLFLAGNINYRHKVRQELSLTAQKPLARPLRLVMLSDLHLGYHNPRKELARWVDMINDEHPDVVFIGGDIIDMSLRPLLEERMADELRRIEAPVYACLGNHEYYSGEPGALRFYREAGIHLLRDSAAIVGPLLIIGRDDRANPHRQNLNRLCRQVREVCPEARPAYTILLDHQPHHLEQAEHAGIDFQFSGHTHRGQVWPISWITDAVYECSHGFHQRGSTRYYVSSGIGIWGGKFRIGTHSEYVVATLK